MPRRDLDKWRAANGGYDLCDRQQPRHIGLPDYLLLVARIEPARVRLVPKTAIPEDGHDDDGPFAFVACPCGARPIVRAPLERCPSCERYYCLVFPRVFVTYGAMAPPPLPDRTPPTLACGGAAE